MSNFTDKVIDKVSREIKTCVFVDNYFGRHSYGFVIEGEVLNTDEFEKRYDRVENQ